MRDLRQTGRYAQRMKKLGWEVFEISDNKTQIFVRSLGLFGAMAKIQRTVCPLPWGEIFRELKRKHVWLVKYEPDIVVSDDSSYKNGQLAQMIGNLNRLGFKLDKWPMLPTRTLEVSLIPKEPEILSSFRKDARYSIRRGLAGGDIKYKVNQYEEFYQTWVKGAKIKRLWMPGKKEFIELTQIFGNSCFSLTAHKDNECVAGVFVLMADKRAYYFYSTTLPQGKQINAPYLLVWEAMKEAKKRGCVIWDFEGIYDGRFPNNSWLGFSHFKKSFGGKEVTYLGSFTKWTWPF